MRSCELLSDFVSSFFEHNIKKFPEKAGLVVNWAHQQSSVEGYPKIVHSLNIKNVRSDTPLS